MEVICSRSKTRNSGLTLLGYNVVNELTSGSVSEDNQDVVLYG